MKIQIIFLEEFGKAFIPKRIRPKLRKYLFKANITEVPYKLFGAFFYLSLIITYFIYFNLFYPYVKGTGTLVFLVGTFVFWVVIQLIVIGLIILAIYWYIDYTVFKRTKSMEEILQDYLRYVSENLKGGMSFDKALWASIRPRFGVLADEIRLVAKKSMAGDDIEDALKEFTEKYNSPMLKRNFNLIVEGMKGGAEIAELIDRIEDNLRETKELKQDMAATNTTYAIFLTVIVTILSPGLFALAYNLILVLIGLSEKIGTSGGSTGGMGIAIGKIVVDPQSFISFSIAAIAVIAVFASMIVSIIRKGEIKQGVKYIPIYGAISIFLYFVFRNLLEGIFGGIMA